MPDLSWPAAHSFWRAYQDPTIYKVIALMEGVEAFTLDGDPELEDSLKKLGDTLDDAGNIDLALESEMINLVAHIKTSRGLRLLMALDTAYPGAASKVLRYAEENSRSEKDMAGIFLKRNVIFERLRLLTRMFAKDRCQLIIKVLEERGG